MEIANEIGISEDNRKTYVAWNGKHFVNRISSKESMDGTSKKNWIDRNNEWSSDTGTTRKKKATIATNGKCDDFISQRNYSYELNEQSFETGSKEHNYEKEFKGWNVKEGFDGQNIGKDAKDKATDSMKRIKDTKAMKENKITNLAKGDDGAMMVENESNGGSGGHKRQWMKVMQGSEKERGNA